ncbi:trypsin-like peptidase domain-containing protein [Streptomyces olivaceus]|uniref:Trypsin-like peptidase domain-containing protein n=1 Tax=Streptomyces olivaceus TaxID=47716 RepID=A0ABS7WAV0_STROV|nr:trypsin-like peptidase domain-containing protein [Streptomyces olivaceus]MBZ6091960.1 trypsin-like peptidase domain-containing protein [Streptomyces olivaceus]MBZ6099143.1 trypsin-like peptidase domain-containing protein [Streptomyces olivaceus]MBZ6119748.1 trypsin-like peptidase domain-containing protein [Streptomyces olivaceus]MBZ6155091.1 trypsin-like peptidase domain-containing protein [Streptomyces olivaceus]MBZ6301162.1 trypsin-like peptidase domain-containing protein [Streptomyces ol
MASRNRSREVAGGKVGGRTGAGTDEGPRDARGTPSAAAVRPAERAPDAALIRISDLAGRPRGTGFLADHHGTVLTSHEAVDGLSRLVLRTAEDRRRVVAAADVTPLPALGLALVRAEGLGVAPLPVATRDRVEAGTYVRIAAGGWREARVLGAGDVTYTATDRFHLIGDALELAVGMSGRDALRLGGGAAGGPVLDVSTGAVLGLLGTALSSGHSDVGFAVPLRRAAGGPLADLLAENAATVPAYGADLNPAGVLALTATSAGQDAPSWAPAPGGAEDGAPAAPSAGPASPGRVEPVERASVTRDFTAFAASRASVLALVGAPGTGRTTELAALAARRARGTRPAPTLWLRGADLRDDDRSLADAVRRTLARAARIVAASGTSGAAWPDGTSPERLARLADSTGRPLLLLLDGPEEMPPVLAHRLPEWTDATAAWLQETGARLVVACRAEYWEHAGAEFPRELLYGTETGADSAAPRARRVRPAQGAGDALPPRSEDTRSTRCTAPDEACSARLEPASPFGVGAGRRAPGRATGTPSPHTAAAEPPATARRRPQAPAPAAPDTDLRPPAGGSGFAWAGPAGSGSAVLGPAGPVSAGMGPAGPVSAGLGPAGRASAGPGPVGPVTPDGSGPEPPAPAGRWSQSPAAAGQAGGVAAPPQGQWPVAAGERLSAPAGPAPRATPSARSAYGAPAPAVRSDSDSAGPRTPAGGGGDLPPCVRLGDLTGEEAREARARHRVPDGALTDADAGHPLTLRLLSEVHAALPGPPSPVPVDRDTVFQAYLDLMCLRAATRLARENGLHGTPVRRLAAKVSGQVHEAARRSLGPGQGGLDRESFEALFPWGPAPALLGGGTGWASAVLAEGLLVPAGDGYRFAHEELADWIQGTHLDLPEALRALVHRGGAPHGAPTLPVPHHRIGSVVEAALLLGRQHGALQLALTLGELVQALDLDPHSWWAAHLLAGVLTRVPDATPYTEVLRLLADGIAERREREEGRPPPEVFGPDFWTSLRLPESTRLDLLRRLVLADGPPHEPGPRHLDTVAGLLTADPGAVQPLLVRWFDDERPLPSTPHATVATAAQALLHTHRHLGLDGLTDVLVGSAHRRADELLAVLAEEEPSALCRAVERWARDERPARQTAAVTHGLRTAPHARTAADRTLLRHAALVLLAGPADSPLRGGALGLLVHDPGSRDRHLPRALDHFAAGDPYLPPGAVAAALPTHPEPVLEAFRARLCGPDTGEALRRLADATTPPLAHRVAALLGRSLTERPEAAGHLAAYVDRRLDTDPAPRAVLLPLVTRLLDDGPESARAALAGILATDRAPALAPGPASAGRPPGSGPLRRELREHLLAHEQAPAVLDALLHAAAACDGGEQRTLVHRIGLLLVRTPEGAARFDRGLVDLARHLPGLAARLTGWLTDAPHDWAALVGPTARRTLENLAGARVPA